MNVGLYRSYCVKQLDSTGAHDQTFSSQWLTDLELACRLDQLTFGVGAQNLFDVYPEQVLPQLQPQGVRYSTTNAFGINGRTLYAKATLKF